MEHHFNSGYYNINGKIIYFRSRWEANVALYLDFLFKNKEIKNWLYEPHFFEFPIKHGTTRYLPDFQVTNNDGSIEYWEVKGFMDSKSKTKLKRMAKYYPKVKIVLIDKVQMKELDKFSKLLNFYK